MSQQSTEALAHARELAEAHRLIAQLETRLDEVNTRLVEAEKGKSQFVSNVVNEINNPLAAIIGLAEQCMEMKEPAWGQIQQSLEWVRDEGTHLQFHLRNIFMASELEAGVAKMNRTRVDVHSVVNAVTLRYLALAQRKGVTLQCNGGHALLSQTASDRYLNSDCAALNLIFANMLDNAIKFSPPDASLRVFVDKTPKGLKLTVENDGPAISAKDRELIFDRFRQADGTTTKKYRGLGLGLTVATSCAELLGGRLELDLDDGQGSRFTLSLPSISDTLLTDASEENVFFFDSMDSDPGVHDETL